MKKQTAIEWLIENYFGNIENCTPNFRNKINEAKKLEREQIINAYDAGTFYLEGGLYYKETFETETVCDFNYYDIRVGKCQHAKVVHGKIICEIKNCQ